MFRPYILAIFRLWFNLQSSYTRCVRCSLRVLGVGWGERDLVVSTVVTVTWGSYEWIIISRLCTYVKVCYYSYAKDKDVVNSIIRQQVWVSVNNTTISKKKRFFLDIVVLLTDTHTYCLYTHNGGWLNLKWVSLVILVSIYLKLARYNVPIYFIKL